MPARDDSAPHVVLGAGLAGLSLATALVRHGVRAPIIVIDRRTDFPEDRTWCFWDVRPGPWSALAAHRWARWEVRRGAAVSTAGDARRPYVHVPADSFYQHAIEVLAAAPNAELRLGETILDVDPLPHHVRVRTSAGELDASRVYDARGEASPAWRAAPRAPVELRQRFLGLVVRTERPVFDQTTVTLMDFGLPQDVELRFRYVLPFSSTRALVEDTGIGFAGTPGAERRSAIAAWLAACGAGAWEVEREERGALPMTMRLPAPDPAGRVLAVGVAAGAARPSSGYAFTRTQAHVERVAEAVATGHTPPVFRHRPRTAVLDAVFLRALADHPGDFPGHFLRLVREVPPAAFARFMADAASPADELAVVGALPPLPFLRATLTAARRGATSRARPVHA